MNMNTYWERLKPHMDAAGVSKASLARELKISYQSIKKVADGGAFGIENNFKVAKFFGLSPEWLATGKGQMKIPDDFLWEHSVKRPERTPVDASNKATNSAASGLDALSEDPRYIELHKSGNLHANIDFSIRMLSKLLAVSDGMERELIRVLLSALVSDPSRWREIAERLKTTLTFAKTGDAADTTEEMERDPVKKV